MSKKTDTTLTKLKRFIKGNTEPKAGTPGCANYDHHYGGCLFADTCSVLEGKRCKIPSPRHKGYWFERCVLPTCKSDVRQAYEKMTGVYIEGQAINLCGGCGRMIPPRRRYCDKCKKKRRQKTRRIYQQKFRRSQKISA